MSNEWPRRHTTRRSSRWRGNWQWRTGQTSMKLVFSLKYLYSAIEEGSNLNIERQNEKRMAIYIQELPMDLVCSFDPNSQWISFERIVKEYRPGVTIARLPELENETHVMRVTWSGKSGVLMIAQNAIDAVEDASN